PPPPQPVSATAAIANSNGAPCLTSFFPVAGRLAGMRADGRTMFDMNCLSRGCVAQPNAARISLRHGNGTGVPGATENHKFARDSGGEARARLRAHFVGADARRALEQPERTLAVGPLEHGEIGDE